MENNGDFIKVEKLQNADDWPMWKFDLQVLLRAADLMDIVSGVAKAPILAQGQSADAAHQTALSKFKKEDYKAQKIIVTALGKQPKVHVMNCNTSKEMWDKLLSVYDQNSKSSVHLIQLEYYNYSKATEDDIAMFVSKLLSIVQKMKDNGTVISDEMVITKILMCLPEEYNHFHSAWESTATADQTIDNLTSRLVIEERRLEKQHQTKASEALIAKTFNKKSFNKSKSIQCYGCKNFGHIQRDCRARRREMDDSDEQSRSGNSCESSVGNVRGKALITLAQAMAVSNTDRAESWFLDSGATDHMTSNNSWFAEYHDFSTVEKVRIGDGSLIDAKGIGKINILAFNGSKWCERHLTDVLYVPKIHLNLFSQLKALDKDLTMTCNSKRCEFFENGESVVVCNRNSNLFRLEIKVIQDEVESFSASKETVLQQSSRRCGTKATIMTEGNVSLCTVALSIWHERLGHQNIGYVKQFLRMSNITFKDEKDFFCQACQLGKHHRSPFQRSVKRAEKVGELVHTDVCGTMHEKSIGGSRYFVLFKDDFSSYRTVYFIKQKSEVPGCIEKYLKLNKNNSTVSVIRSDNGLEFTSQSVQKLLNENGVQHQKTVPHTPEQNGRAEREMRTIVEAARTMIHSKELPLKFWAEAVNTAVYVLNRTGPSHVQGKTPYELFFGKKAEIGHLKAFGIDVYVHIPKIKRKKWNKKAKQGILVGYCEDTKGYRVWIPEERKIEISRDITFREVSYNSVSIQQESESENYAVFGPDTLVKNDQNDEIEFSKNAQPGSDMLVENGQYENDQQVNNAENDSDQYQSVGGSDDEEDNEQSGQSGSDADSVIILSDEEKGPGSKIENNSFVSQRTRFTIALSACMELGNAFISVSEPKTYKEALESIDNLKWKEAMDDEYNSLIKNKTWELVDLPKGRTVIDNKWVYKVKEKANGEVERYKARLVVRGFTQEHGIDYNETFSPVVKYTSFRLICSMAAMENLHLSQFDVKTAFLYGELTEEIYMKQPFGYEDGSSKVCRLIQCLYGLKQASRNWNEKFTKFLKAYELQVSAADPCVFISVKNGRKIVLGLFIDDGIIAASHQEDITSLLSYLTQKFEIRVLPADYFLGFEIDQRQDKSIHLSQKAYTTKILTKFNMLECKSVSTPAEYNNTVVPSDLSKNYPFREAVGSLMYLSVGTRPDIAYAVGKVSRKLNQPSEADVVAVKRIFRYLKGTMAYGIIYEKNAEFSLNCFSDSDYGGDPESRKSTTGFVFVLGSGAISWSSQLQKCVTLSSTEAEYVAGAQSIKDLVWVRQLFDDLKIGITSTVLKMDNQSAIRLVKNPEFHKRTKHIDIMYHFIREKFRDALFELVYVPTDEQVADILTKALSNEKFVKFRTLMGLCN